MRENLGKAGKVLGISSEPGYGISSWNGGKRVPLGDANSTEVKKVGKEGLAEEEQVQTLHLYLLVEATP